MSIKARIDIVTERDDGQRFVHRFEPDELFLVAAVQDGHLRVEWNVPTPVEMGWLLGTLFRSAVLGGGGKVLSNAFTQAVSGDGPAGEEDLKTWVVRDGEFIPTDHDEGG